MGCGHSVRKISRKDSLELGDCLQCPSRSLEYTLACTLCISLQSSCHEALLAGFGGCLIVDAARPHSGRQRAAACLCVAKLPEPDGKSPKHC